MSKLVEALNSGIASASPALANIGCSKASGKRLLRELCSVVEYVPYTVGLASLRENPSNASSWNSERSFQHCKYSLFDPLFDLFSLQYQQMFLSGQV